MNTKKFIFTNTKKLHTLKISFNLKVPIRKSFNNTHYSTKLFEQINILIIHGFYNF